VTDVLLECRGLSAGYGGIAVVRDLDLHVGAGEVVALFGPNGAGKTTTLLTLAGELPPIAGEIRWLGTPTSSPLHRRAKAGLGLVTEDRSVFMELTTAQNLRVGGVSPEDAVAIFPELEALLSRQAGLLSGGEQQMLTLARTLARHSRVVLADELSLGLAPLVVARLLEKIRTVATDEGVGVLLVEQHVRQALDVVDRVYVLRRGELVLSGAAAEMRGRLEELEDAYLSDSAGDADGNDDGTAAEGAAGDGVAHA